MTRTKLVVQFLHPGGEHHPVGAVMDWNRGPHRRKFIVAPGRAVRDQEQFRGDLGFWGEWEPQSEVQLVDHSMPGGPTYLHSPFYRRPDSYRGLQNTDPCVFGGFRYTCCQQHFKGRPNSMQMLPPGSLILFGSCVANEFVLDTAFVTRDGGVAHDSTTFATELRDLAPPAYFDVTLGPWYSDPFEPSRFYEGATIDDPFKGTYSFFPAVPWTGDGGFGRPIIQIPHVITGSQRQGKKLSAVTTEQARQIWEAVVGQVIEAGLWLGVTADWPARR